MASVSAVWGMALWQLKLAVICVTLAVAMLGVSAPRLMFRKGQNTTRYGIGLSLGNMLSAGVMMGAGLVHLLPEAHEALTKALGVNVDEPFPWAMVLCGAGFIFTLCLAQLLEPFTKERKCIKCDSDDDDLPVVPGGAILTKGLIGEFETHPWHREGGVDRTHTPHHSHREIQGASHVGHSRNGHHTHATSGSACNGGDPEVPLLEPLILTAGSTEDGRGDIVGSSKQTKTSSIMLTTGLMIHSALEGAAIGAQASVSSSLSVAIAVVAHKGLAGYAIGSSLISSNSVSTSQFVTHLMGFSLATPIGIALGWLLSLNQVEDSPWSASVSAASAGTFLYSAVVEVLGNELRGESFDPDNIGHSTMRVKALKLFMFCLGFIAMCIVSKYS